MEDNDLVRNKVLTVKVIYVKVLSEQTFQKFFSENKAPSAERAIKQSLEGIKLRCSWLERDGEAVAQWFKDHGF